MEVFTHNIKSDHVSIFLFGDVHEGNANHDRSALERMVKYIEETAEKRAVHVIGMGDYIDAINTKDPRFSPSEIEGRYKIKDLKDLPRKQMKAFYDSIKPVAKYMGHALVGNHEESYIKHGGFDVYDYLCSDLLEDCRKVGFFGMVRFDVGSAHRGSFSFCLTHGTGGGGFREGYALNNMFDIFRKFRADFYVMGHVHKIETRHYDFQRVAMQGPTVKRDREWYGCSGCFLDSYRVGNRNYFEGQKGEMSHIGFLEARIDYVSRNGKGGWETTLIKHIY